VGNEEVTAFSSQPQTYLIVLLRLLGYVKELLSLQSRQQTKNDLIFSSEIHD